MEAAAPANAVLLASESAGPVEPAPAAPGISVLVVTFWTGPFLYKCVTSVLAQTDIAELIIIDNGNPAEARAALLRLTDMDERVQIVVNKTNIGFGRAINQAARLATGARLLILNPDAEIQSDTIAELTRAATPLSGAWLIGGRVLHPDGQEQRGSRREELTLWSAAVTFSGLGKLEPLLPFLRSVHRERDPLPDAPRPQAVVSGAFMFTPRTTFWALGGFDEGYFLHVEDIDLCRRLRAAGGVVIHAPKAKIVHKGSTSQVSIFFVEWHKAKGLIRYFRKFARNPLEAALAWIAGPAIAGMLVARAVLIGAIAGRYGKNRAAPAIPLGQ